MWKSVFATLVLLASVPFLNGCQHNNPVTTDYDTAADFSTYRRYAWLDERSGADKAFNPLLAERVKNAVSDGLNAHQFETAADKTQADFLVRYYLKTDEKTEDTKAHGGISMGSYGGNVGMGISLNFPLGGAVVEQRAQILIDFVSGNDQKLAWRGSRTFVLKGDDSNALSGQLRVIVDQILAEFPPR